MSNKLIFLLVYIYESGNVLNVVEVKQLYIPSWFLLACVIGELLSCENGGNIFFARVFSEAPGRSISLQAIQGDEVNT